MRARVCWRRRRSANSISEAAAHGVPILGLPLSWDQPANVSAVERLQIGRGLPLPECTADALLEAMRGVLDDARMQESAARLAEQMKAADTGADGAAELVERAARLGVELEAEFQEGHEARGSKPEPVSETSVEVLDSKASPQKRTPSLLMATKDERRREGPTPQASAPAEGEEEEAEGWGDALD